jgi:hypothetical protein
MESRAFSGSHAGSIKESHVLVEVECSMPTEATEITVYDMHGHGDMKFGNGSERNCIENLTRSYPDYRIMAFN